MKNKLDRKDSQSFKWVRKIIMWTFLLSVIFNVVAELLVTKINISFGFIILIIIVLIGIVFDIIGVAVTSSSDKPFHAMAANKVEEGKHALKLVKNASQVSNFCNDVIGDICGIISGAVGSTIIFKLSTKYNLGDSVILGVGVTAFIASFTVGGKALGKSFAMENSEDIIFKVAQVLSFLKRKFNIELFKEKKKLKIDRKE